MTLPRRILLLTADPALTQLLPTQLGQEGEFAVAATYDPEAPAGEAEVLLLDAALPPSAAENASRLAARAGGRPILLLGGEEAESPRGVERVPKPIRLADLKHRLHARLAAFDASPEAAIPLGPFSFHAAGRILTEGARRIRLTETEAAILSYLHRAAPRPVPREELLGEVWGYSAAVATHTLETHIYRLRRKLGEAGALLRREPGGYCIG
ncbi:response regulator transcription factor [Sabulicella glaciei]|uniref:Response regulator transcription factor n=1 Tax=Sabulicella glaciei TaxID=2984948 RepID=A0ABT3NSA2_9PROT|nr:response regulator transcription factor [Roseococcus sp. MDT2-1-1]MCW8085048.1 response regulator transcription factor [Roseococcus sp. MDT2-1-1]